MLTTIRSLCFGGRIQISCCSMALHYGSPLSLVYRKKRDLLGVRFVVFPLLKISDWDNEKVGAVHSISDMFMCICDACYDLSDTFQSFFTNFFVREKLLVVFVHESSTIYACICTYNIYTYTYIYIHIHMIILFHIHLMHLLLQCI